MRGTELKVNLGFWQLQKVVSLGLKGVLNELSAL
jgi:hypothetical protein